MLLKSILKDCKIMTALDYASAAASRNGATIDTLGFNSIAYIVKLAAISDSAVSSFKAQHGEASNASDMADVEASSISIAGTDDNKIKVHDCGRVTKRYHRCVITKDGTNACAETVIAILYNSDKQPVTQPSEVTGEFDALATSGTA